MNFFKNIIGGGNYLCGLVFFSGLNNIGYDGFKMIDFSPKYDAFSRQKLIFFAQKMDFGKPLGRFFPTFSDYRPR